MKKIVIIIMSVVFMLSTVSSVFAESDQFIIGELSDGTEYILNTKTNEKLLVVYKSDINGNMIRVPLREAAYNLNNPSRVNLNYPRTKESSVLDLEAKTTENSSETMMRSYPTFTGYVLKNAMMTSGSDAIGVRVTNIINGGPLGASITHGNSVTINDSYEGSFGINGKVKDAIELGASFSWNHSVATATEFSATHLIPAKEIGYVKFYAFYDIVYGDLYEETYSYQGIKIDSKKLGRATGRSPKKLNGFADGYFTIVIQ